MKKVIILIVTTIIIAIAIWRIQAGPRLEEQKRVLMDTYVSIIAYGPKKITGPAIDKAFGRMREAADKFNAHNPESPLYAFNQEHKPITDVEILRVAAMALEVSRMSEGAFDITVYPLVKLWGFYADLAKAVPPQDKIQEALGNIGWQHLAIKDGQLTSDKESIHIDLASIAKGYAAAQAIETLKAQGIKSAVVVAGGDVYALGTKKGKPWKVGIRHPRKDGLLGYVEVEDRAVMGSGDYERFFIKDGKRYHHILDPKTGYPATGASGVTVIHPDPAFAGAWGTALLVLGPEKGMEIAKQILGMEVIMVSEDGKQIFCTPGLEKLIK